MSKEKNGENRLETLSRRDFLRKAGIFAGGTVVGASLLTGCSDGGTKTAAVNADIKADLKVEKANVDPFVFKYGQKPAVETTSPGKVLPVLPPEWKLPPVKPVKLFDNCYFVGSEQVGAFVIDTGKGLIMLDNGWGLADTEGGKPDIVQMVEDFKKIGLNAAHIKLILISHEHIDHYGGTSYLKEKVCPDAKVAMSLLGWNYLQTWPAVQAFAEPRPKSVDIFLEDRQIISMGKTKIQVVATPGHSMGCLSFIITVTDNGTPHVIGLMGGSSVQKNWDEALVYYTSVNYFQGYTKQAKCDIGLAVHASKYFKSFDYLRNRQPGDTSNPLVIGTEKFETEYLESYRQAALKTMQTLPPATPPPPPPTKTQ